PARGGATGRPPPDVAAARRPRAVGAVHRRRDGRAPGGLPRAPRARPDRPGPDRPPLRRGSDVPWDRQRARDAGGDREGPAPPRPPAPRTGPGALAGLGALRRL